MDCFHCKYNISNENKIRELNRKVDAGADIFES